MRGAVEGGDGGHWLLGLATAAAAGGGASARLLWCAPLPGPPAGQIALAVGANASTSFVLVAGRAIVGLG